MSKYRVYEVFQTEMFYLLYQKMQHPNAKMMWHLQGKGINQTKKRIQKKLAVISGIQENLI